VFGGPALADGPTAAVLARHTDGLVIVTETGATPRAAIVDAVASARATGCALLGLVAVDSPSGRSA
jgi:Mrp family chromosome partitioning ATPase